jgi:hypothetical protein
MDQATLDLAFDKIENQRTSLLERLKSSDDRVLNQKPSESQWSVIEVINHLVMAERFSYQYLQKKTQDKSSAHKVGIRETFRSFLLNRYLYSSKKFRSPEVALPSADYMTMDDASESWHVIRKNIRTIWVEMPSDLLDRNWFKHPVAGRLSLRQMISFMEAHVSRHEKQIWRTLKVVNG